MFFLILSLYHSDKLPRRIILAILIFFASLIVFAQRICLSVAIKYIALELDLSSATQGGNKINSFIILL